MRQFSTRLTSPIPSRIPTAHSLIAHKPIHTPIRTTKTVFPRSTLAPVLARTVFARMPTIPVPTTSRARYRTAISVPMISVLHRTNRSLRRHTCLTFNRAPSRPRLVPSSYIKNASMRRTISLYPPATVGPPRLSSDVNNVNSPTPQMRALSSLPSARWYRVAFKCSSGPVMPVRTPYLHALSGLWLTFLVLVFTTLRLDLQHRRRAGRHR